MRFDRVIKLLLVCIPTTRSNSSATSSSVLAVKQSAPKSVYIHIPFCKRRCFYCDFPIQVVGNRKSTVETVSEEYVNYLLKEMQFVASNFKDSRVMLETIYFGGGTPSLLPDNQIIRIMSELDRLFGVSSSTEVTLEMDPGTFTSGRLTLLQQVGVNRVSMGVQSFNDELLKKCGRAHNLQEVYNAIDALHKSGLKNFSIDLISSLPFLTLDLWKDTLSCAVKAGTPHISIYDLQVEERTAFGRWYTPGEFPLPTDEISAEMYKTGVEILTSNGFEHYEVSNYAKDGYRSRHNQQYWKREQVYGFGVGAASYVKGVRFSRPPRINDYYNYVNSLVSQDIPDLKRDQAKNVEEDDMLESIMLALRTADGIDVTKFEREYGLHAIKKIAKSLFPFEENVICLVDEKPIQLNTLLNAVESNNHSSIRLRLSDPKGFLISNDIISSVFAAF